VTLFALLNGDDIMGKRTYMDISLCLSIDVVAATFSDLGANYPYLIISRVYLYTFVATQVVCVLNVFIFIVEDAFKAAKSVR
jgi:hypothetical protein